MSSYCQEESKQISTTETILIDVENKNEVGLLSWKSSESKKPLASKSKDRTTNFVEFSLSRLHLSSGKHKPIIRKSKLKFIGNHMLSKRQCTSQKERFPSGIGDAIGISSHAHEPGCLIERYKLCLCDANFITKTIRPLTVRNIFEKGKDVVPLQDFKSLSLKEKWINLDDENETIGNFDFVSHCTFRNSKEPKEYKSSKTCLQDSELPDLKSLTLSEHNRDSKIKLSCAKQARNNEEFSTDELAAYLDNYLHFPKKMSFMAEMMYT